MESYLGNWVITDFSRRNLLHKISWLNSYSPDRNQGFGLSHKLWPHGFVCLNNTNEVCSYICSDHFQNEKFSQLIDMTANNSVNHLLYCQDALTWFHILSYELSDRWLFSFQLTVRNGQVTNSILMEGRYVWHLAVLGTPYCIHVTCDDFILVIMMSLQFIAMYRC